MKKLSFTELILTIPTSALSIKQISIRLALRILIIVGILATSTLMIITIQYQYFMISLIIVLSLIIIILLLLNTWIFTSYKHLQNYQLSILYKIYNNEIVFLDVKKAFHKEKIWKEVVDKLMTQIYPEVKAPVSSNQKIGSFFSLCFSSPEISEKLTIYLKKKYNVYYCPISVGIESFTGEKGDSFLSKDDAQARCYIDYSGQLDIKIPAFLNLS